MISKDCYFYLRIYIRIVVNSGRKYKILCVILRGMKSPLIFYFVKC